MSPCAVKVESTHTMVFVIDMCLMHTFVIMSMTQGCAEHPRPTISSNISFRKNVVYILNRRETVAQQQKRGRRGQQHMADSLGLVCKLLRYILFFIFSLHVASFFSLHNNKALTLNTRVIVEFINPCLIH